ncbi:tRNA epoxyqueuosine(34) reductase QueG [Tumidithrix elongata RA019]|uniref:Epoxyqueuosine reductase n=1 Tax=Tumidithrix elongata BACA0141 TaxID=2716417 RepID=A0AAW9Q138_9CYAN|nr:tRNA epoxyqueuosine(34) reductase QueG [Tumidithrix elongata RA019]
MVSKPPFALTTLQIKQKAIALGFSKVGITPARSGKEVEHLNAWLAMGYHADMAWMQNPKRQDITQVMAGVKSIICVALNYYTPHEHQEQQEYAKISRYGWGRDYHRILGKRLKALCAWMEAQSSDTESEHIQTRYYVDTGPISEKALAERAGIGWIGKHGNLITREYGSWVFLGEILTNLDLEPDTPHTQHCGTCTRCIDACPTEAIAQPFVVDANRCIAFHTIESKAAELPTEVAASLNNWVAGCDICQDVCPWNQRFAQPTLIEDFQPYPQNLAPKLEELAMISEQEWEQTFTGSALRRIKPERLRRNAKAAIAQKTTDVP